MISDDPLPHQPPPPALWREPLEPHSKPRPPEGGLPTMLGRKPHHAALGTPMLGKVHPCYLGNPHSLGGPGTTQRGRSPRMLQRELRDLEGGFHLSMGWRRPPSYFGNPEPQRGSPSFPALGGGGVPALWRKPHHPEGVPTPSIGKRVPRNTLETPCTRRWLPALTQERARSSPPPRPPFPTSRSTLATPLSGEGARPSPSREGLLLKTGKI